MKRDIQLKNVFDTLLNKKFRWLYHFLFWLVVFAEDIDSLLHEVDPNYISTFFILGFEMFIVYFNIYYLFKRYLVKGKIKVYLIYTSLFILVYAAANYLLFYCFIEDIPENKDLDGSLLPAVSVFIMYTFRMFSIIGTAVGITILKHYFLEQKQIQDLKRNSLENELLYLKNQINPHFLFNSLNNIYTLSKKNHQNTSEAVLLLSELLRYQLYDCSKEKVLLKDEIDYLQRFIKLEALRKKDRTINFTISGESGGIKIAPFLFMPFVENAIKFGMLADDPSVNIAFTISREEIKFTIENNSPKTVNSKSDSGIGLKNVMRRLDLLYHNEHQLIIDDTKNKFHVTLILTNEKN
jgi:two-component system LytT family sensor kinase